MADFDLALRCKGELNERKVNIRTDVVLSIRRVADVDVRILNVRGSSSLCLSLSAEHTIAALLGSDTMVVAGDMLFEAKHFDINGVVEFFNANEGKRKDENKNGNDAFFIIS